MASPSEVIHQLGGYTPAPVGVVVDRRRSSDNEPKECNKLDMFDMIRDTLERLNDKSDKIDEKLIIVHQRIDKLTESMTKMIQLEQQLLSHARDISDLEKTIDELKNQKLELERKVLTLQHKFENHEQSVSKFERLGWMLISGIGAIAGAYALKQMGLS